VISALLTPWFFLSAAGLILVLSAIQTVNLDRAKTLSLSGLAILYAGFGWGEVEAFLTDRAGLADAIPRLAGTALPREVSSSLIDSAHDLSIFKLVFYSVLFGLMLGMLLQHLASLRNSRLAAGEAGAST